MTLTAWADVLVLKSDSSAIRGTDMNVVSAACRQDHQEWTILLIVIIGSASLLSEVNDAQRITQHCQGRQIGKSPNFLMVNAYSSTDTANFSLP